jgi:hypothetical protein
VTDYVLAAQERADMAFMNVAAPSSSERQQTHVAMTERQVARANVTMREIAQ